MNTRETMDNFIIRLIPRLRCRNPDIIITKENASLALQEYFTQFVENMFASSNIEIMLMSAEYSLRL